jgi:hypothetical protein
MFLQSLNSWTYFVSVGKFYAPGIHLTDVIVSLLFTDSCRGR